MSRSLLPLRTRCELALAASNGLAYLHELRIVHFDLKPDNLLLDAPPAVVRAAAGADLEEPVVGIRISSAAAGAAGAGAVTAPANSAARGAADADGSSHGGSGAASAAGGRSPTGSSRGGRSNRRSSGPLAAASSLECCEVPVVKVADFGLSKHKLNSTYVSSCRDLRGTLPYMAPELVADPERVCEKADVWSLGVVMWEMLTREIPFQVCMTGRRVQTLCMCMSAVLRMHSLSLAAVGQVAPAASQARG
jgi:serine/threonine protein kinase